MKYSVVIPLYNKEKYIARALSSVLSQTCQNFEILVVDDGSTDHSFERASQIDSEKIKMIRQENQGAATARNTGIACASGDYIAFLDADDAWREDYLETMDHLTETYSESDIYVTAYAIHMNKGKVRYSGRLSPETGCLDSYWLTFQYPYDFVWTSATVIQREAIQNAGGFKPGEKIGQDLDLWARVARENPKVAYSSKVCVDYHRMAEENARTRVKIAYAGAFISDLEEELLHQKHTKEECDMIQKKYDLKMTAYIFTCILAGEKQRAAGAFQSWKGKTTSKTKLLRAGLRISMYTPQFLNRWIYSVRLRVF